MKNSNIAIVGLERSGELLLEWLIKCGDQCPNIICAVAFNGGAGRHRADVLGVALVSLDRLADLSDQIDVILDLTKDEVLLELLHQKLIARGNHHTSFLSGEVTQLTKLLQPEQPQQRIA